MTRLVCWFFSAALIVFASVAQAQDLRVATVEREPFSFMGDEGFEGFSIDLMNRVTEELGLSVEYILYDSFSDMLNAVQTEEVDAAIANISITSDRETRMDFSQPMFDSGIQVMVPSEQGTSPSVFSALFTKQIGIAVLSALALLFGGGMLMWVFERKVQPYFDRPLKDAPFPAFWWALNLVVNGGFEERMPQSRAGRFFAVGLVISSLFIVSIFVAQITAALTINAISENIQDLNDLDGRRIGTIEGSTSAAFLDIRDLSHVGFADAEAMFQEYEAGGIDAVVFDSPILAYYVAERSGGDARLLDRVYRAENYGIAFPTDSALRERVDRVLLGLREQGVFDELTRKWFGMAYSGR